MIDAHSFLKDKLKAEKRKHHDAKTLYEHLSNVEKILRICDCDESVCLAGLFHSIYGTEFYKNKPTDDRKLIKEIIGERAEKLVWIFCNAKRPFCWFFGQVIPLKDGSFVRVDNKMMKDLHMIEGANLLEQHDGLHEIVAFSSWQESPADISVARKIIDVPEA